MTEKNVLTEVKGDLFLVKLNRPELNGLLGTSYYLN